MLKELKATLSLYVRGEEQPYAEFELALADHPENGTYNIALGDHDIRYKYLNVEVKPDTVIWLSLQEKPE